MAAISLDRWAFIPGPAATGTVPFLSTEVTDTALYPIAEVAEAFLQIPGFRLIHPAHPTWYDWKSCWERQSHHLLLGMSQFEDAERSWGGSEFAAVCEVSDVLAILRILQKRFPRVWLHNQDCEVHNAESFAQRYAP
jgi:hypothetical protein